MAHVPNLGLFLRPSNEKTYKPLLFASWGTFKSSNAFELFKLAKAHYKTASLSVNFLKNH
jgi:hypothetical protein